MTDLKMPQTNKPQINTSTKPAEAAAAYINDLLAVHIDKPILLLVAGGSATQVLNLIKPEYLGDHITVTVTDDRFTEDVEHNNFATMQITPFYDELIQVDAYCINTQLFGEENIETHRARFEKNLRDWQKDFPKGTIIGLFGMGADGHVAGIIPGVYSEEEFAKKFDDKDYVAHVDATGKNDHPLRVTTTFPFMRLVNYPVFYITGEGKKDALTKALAKEGTLFETPARIMHEMKNAQIFTDISL